ncbi:MAG: DUF4160 domain-containing protein [Eubacterium sp.]
MKVQREVINYNIHISVHVYAEEKLADNVLTPHSKNYGIHGKEIIGPLRKINGKNFLINNVQPQYSVGELWDWIEQKLYKDSMITYYDIRVLDFVREYNVVHKFLIFHNLRYRVDDLSKPLLYYLKKMNASNDEVVNIELLICSDAGSIFEDDGIRYYMHSRESGKHHVPHVHVDIRHEEDGAFSLVDGSQLSDGKIKNKDKKRIRQMILSHQKELLQYWNLHTDGLTADLNQSLGLIQY